MTILTRHRSHPLHFCGRRNRYDSLFVSSHSWCVCALLPLHAVTKVSPNMASHGGAAGDMRRGTSSSLGRRTAMKMKEETSYYDNDEVDDADAKKLRYQSRLVVGVQDVQRLTRKRNSWKRLKWDLFASLLLMIFVTLHIVNDSRTAAFDTYYST